MLVDNINQVTEAENNGELLVKKAKEEAKENIKNAEELGKASLNKGIEYQKSLCDKDLKNHKIELEAHFSEEIKKIDDNIESLKIEKLKNKKQAVDFVVDNFLASINLK